MSKDSNNNKDKDNNPDLSVNFYGDAYIAHRKFKSPFSAWSMNNEMNIRKLAKLRLSGVPYSVFLWMVGNMEFDNLVIVNQTEYAKELEISRFAVVKAIKTLIDDGLIKKTDQRVGTLSVYVINPTYVFKGKNKSFSEVVELFYELCA